jgi:hypothetical protein
VRWVRVGLYALVLSATALNVLGGMVARQVSVRAVGFLACH